MEDPYRQTTERIIQKVMQMRTFNSLKTLIDFVISFYDNQSINFVLQVILEYCKLSLDFCVDALELFDEIFTLIDEMEGMEEMYSNFTFEYLKIVLPFCVIKSMDDETIETRSKLRGSFMAIQSLICYNESTKFVDYLRMILMQNQGNMQIVEAICFIWDAADRLPDDLKGVKIFRPFGFTNH